MIWAFGGLGFGLHRASEKSLTRCLYDSLTRVLYGFASVLYGFSVGGVSWPEFKFWWLPGFEIESSCVLRCFGLAACGFLLTFFGGLWSLNRKPLLRLQDLHSRPSPGAPAAQVPVGNLGQAQPAPGDFRCPLGFWALGLGVRARAL